MSCGSPGRLKTVRFAIRSFIAGFAKWNASVPMIPGTIALAVIPWRPPSIARVFVRPSRPVFVGLLGELRLDEQVGDDDVGARTRKRQSIHAPEPARAPGHERNTPAEVDLDRHQSRGMKISLAITRRWIWDVPS